MKKRWKVFWIICSVLFVLGIVLSLTGKLMGGSVLRFAGTMRDQRKVEGTDSSTAGSGTYEDIRELEIQVNAVELVIEVSPDDQLYVAYNHMPNAMKFCCTQEGNRLTITTTEEMEALKNLYSSNAEPKISIQVPNQMLEDVDIENAAGTIQIRSLQAKELSVSVGAGEAVIQDFGAEDVEFNCGAGRIEASGDVQKAAEIDCGVGEIWLTIYGTDADYIYDVDCSVGTVTVNGTSVTTSAVEDNGSKKCLEISCGVGEVNVDFEK